MTSRPLEGHYAAMLTSALLALVPFILVTTAAAMFRKLVQAEFGAQPVELEIINGLATAGYAFGALLGGDLINRFRQRRLWNYWGRRRQHTRRTRRLQPRQAKHYWLRDRRRGR